MQFRTIAVTRTARYAVEGADPAGARALWFGLHGYGQLAGDFAEALRPLLTAGTRLVVPEGLSRFYVQSASGRIGASWMTREARTHEVADYVAYLDAVRHAEDGTPPVPLHVLGFSQGAATASRWAVAGAARLRTLVLWGGGLPPDLDRGAAPAALAETRAILVNGRGDPYVTPDAVERDAETLRGLGVHCDVRWFDGGHHLKSDLLAALASES